MSFFFCMCEGWCQKEKKESILKLFTILCGNQVEIISMKKKQKKNAKFLISILVYITINSNMRFLDQDRLLLLTLTTGSIPYTPVSFHLLGWCHMDRLACMGIIQQERCPEIKNQAVSIHSAQLTSFPPERWISWPKFSLDRKKEDPWVLTLGKVSSNL